MEKTKGILNALVLDGDGRGTQLLEEDISAAVAADDKLTWIHLDGNESDSREWLKREVKYLDDIIIDALLADETRPRIVEYENGVLLILRGVNLNQDAQPEDMVAIRIWADEHRIISMRRRYLKAAQDIRSRLERGKGPKNSADFITMLSARLFERMEPVFTELDENLDNCEERVMEYPDTTERQKITSIRKQAIMFRRYISPQRDVIARLRTTELTWFELTDKRRLQESHDRVIRYLEDLDTIRERAQIIKDELTNALSDKMNKNLYILSVIAAIFLPLGFLTGLLGINVGGIPGSDNSTAFLIFCGMLVGVVATQVVVFRRLKWF